MSVICALSTYTTTTNKVLILCREFLSFGLHPAMEILLPGLARHVPFLDLVSTPVHTRPSNCVV